MKVLVAISKRRAKRLAGAVIINDANLGWMFFLYTVVDGKAAPFGINNVGSRENALKDANEALKTNDSDWVEVDEGEAEKYIFDRTNNEWNPSQYKKRTPPS
jgi:hypothetical protein